jgi:hypothetical protein
MALHRARSEALQGQVELCFSLLRATKSNRSNFMLSSGPSRSDNSIPRDEPWRTLRWMALPP